MTKQIYMFLSVLFLEIGLITTGVAATQNISTRATVAPTPRNTIATRTVAQRAGVQVSGVAKNTQVKSRSSIVSDAARATTRNTRTLSGGTKNRAATTQTVQQALVSSDILIQLHVDSTVSDKYANLKKYIELSGNAGYVTLIKIKNKLPDLQTLFANTQSNTGVTFSGAYDSQKSGNQVYSASGAAPATTSSATDLYLRVENPAPEPVDPVTPEEPKTLENTCSNDLSGYPVAKTGDTFIKPVQTTNQSTLAGPEDCAAIVKDFIGQCWALRMNKDVRHLIPCENEINVYNLGYGMARINQFTPNGYNPDTYESADTYYFLPWGYNNPVSLMDTNNGYSRVFLFRTAVGTSYGKDESGNTGMLQLPDLTNYVNNLTPPSGKKFAGIYSMWEKDLSKTYHIDGTAGGDFTFTSQKIYDETGKPVNKYIKMEDLPWTYPNLANTGGRPFYMFIIWEDAD